MPSEFAAATIVAKCRLSSARVLAASFRRHHPGVPFFVLLTDEVEGCFDPAREPFETLLPADLAIPGFERLRFRYTAEELSYAATPYLIAHLLDRGFRGAVFLKQESLVLDDLSPVLAALDRHAVLLTPHLLHPLAGADAVERELKILLSGVYNCGFAAFSDFPEARRFLGWWQERLASHCLREVERGMHFEQRWLDFAPAFIESAHIVRDPGMNVAHWNLPERQVCIEGERVTADGAPCRLFRFSGFDPERPEAPTRYFARLTMENIGPAAALYRRYLALLEAAGYHQTKRLPYAWDRYDNGAPIPAIARRIYRDLGERAATFGDPFHTGPGSFFAWLGEPAARGVPRIWSLVHATRPDLQEVFPDPLGRDRRAFLHWVRRHGVREYPGA